MRPPEGPSQPCPWQPRGYPSPVLQTTRETDVKSHLTWLPRHWGWGGGGGGKVLNGKQMNKEKSEASSFLSAQVQNQRSLGLTSLSNQPRTGLSLTPTPEPLHTPTGRRVRILLRKRRKTYTTRRNQQPRPPVSPDYKPHPPGTHTAYSVPRPQNEKAARLSGRLKESPT